MAFCTSRGRFALGWLTGGNRRRFAERVAEGPTQMGIIAWMAGQPIGWCACGPRSRYVTQSGPSRLLRDRESDEDDAVWLMPCIFVHAESRGQGISQALMRSAVDLACQAGALAIEGWPTTESDPTSANAFVGRESVFAELGFRRVASPEPQRVIMRLELTGGPGP